MSSRVFCSFLFLLISASAASGEAKQPFFLSSHDYAHAKTALLGAGGEPPPPANCFTAPPPIPAAPAITSALFDGVTEVKGTAAQPSGAGCTAQVELWQILDQNIPVPAIADKNFVGVGLTDADGHQLLVLLAVSSNISGGQFDIKLTTALLQGQRVCLKEVFDNGQGSSGAIASGPYRVPQFGNWGLVKGYFTSGFLLSQDQGSFSQSNLFLAFTLDKTWALPGGQNQKNAAGHKRRAPGFNTFFDTRLTAIPVTACNTSSAGGTTGSGGQTSTCVQSNTNGSGTTTTPLDTFLASRKTARLGIGVYLPIVAKSWTFGGTPQALFVAPLAEAGVDTPVSSITQAQPSNTGSSDAATSGMVTGVNPTTFYNHYGYGARLGHYAMTKSDSEAPETISYLDVVVGRFSNLESFVQQGNTGPTDLRERLYRVYLEGILKVPGTPLIVGFSANVGQEAIGLGNNHIVQRAGDDLRFLFGARFDVAKLVSKIGKVAP